MSLKPGDNWTGLYTFRDSTGALCDADTAPTATVYVNGVADDWGAVAVTKLSSGLYKVAATIAADLSAGDVCAVVLAGAVEGASVSDAIQFVLDAKRVADLQDLTVAQVNAEADQAIADAGLATSAEITALNDLTAAQVWEYATRTLTGAVDLNADQSGVTIGVVTTNSDMVDISALALSSEITALNNLSAAEVNAQVDAAITDAALATAASVAALNNISTADVLAQASAALVAYDPPTHAEFEARTLPAADYATAVALAAHDAKLVTADGVIDAVKVVTDQLADTLEDNDGVYRFTAESLAEGPTAVGTAPTELTYTVTDSTSGQPLEGVVVYMSTDESGQNMILCSTTDVAGQVTFAPRLDAGTTVYLWRYKGGYSFDNPDSEVIS